MIGIANNESIATDNRDAAFGITLDGHKKQDEIIFELIAQLNKRNVFPDARMINKYFENMLLTSIRRSLSNMLNKDKTIIEKGSRIYRINGRSVPSTTYRVIEQTKLF